MRLNKVGKGTDRRLPKQMDLQSLLSMDALCGWRDVRMTTRNNMDDVSGRFFMRKEKAPPARAGILVKCSG